MRILSRLLFTAVLLYVLGCWGIYHFQEKLIFHPYPIAEGTRLKFQLPHEAHEIKVAPAVSLNAALFQQIGAHGLVLFFHGNTGNIERYEGHVHEFYYRGWDVLSVDYRSFGLSDGELSQETLLSDGLAVFDYCQHDLDYDKIVVYGQSLGSGVTNYIAAERPATAIILEAPYYSMQRIAEDLLPFIPIERLLRYPLPAHSYLEKSQCPVLAFHGTQDRTIPYEAHGLALKTLKPAMELVTLSGGSHNNCRTFPEYSLALDSLLGRLASQ